MTPEQNRKRDDGTSSYDNGFEDAVALLAELAEALEKALWCAENIANDDRWQQKHHEASETLAKYLEASTLSGGANTRCDHGALNASECCVCNPNY